MRNTFIVVGAFLIGAGAITYAPGCTSKPPFIEEGGTTTCKDAGGGMGEGCPCDPAKFGKGKGCFEGPATALKPGTACKSGVRTCNADGTMSACVGQLLPDTEVCDGLDNDCNGVVDDISSDEPVLTDLSEAGLDPPIEAGAQCYVNGEVGLCAAGRYGCNSMQKKDCVSLVKKDPDSGLSPYMEVCNGLDDDCDGNQDNVDWAGQKCSVMLADGGVPKGECANGTRQCLSGVEDCKGPGPMPDTTCNGKDDNCNGQYDETSCPCVNCVKGQYCCVLNGSLLGGCYSSMLGGSYVCYQKP